MLRLGTRASALATWQSAWVARQLSSGGEGQEDGFRLVHISTQGDRDRTSPLTQIGGTGVFVSAVREALLAGEVDVVVHSLKDLPTAPAPGIRMAAVPLREDPRDVLIAREGIGCLAEVPRGARIGTGSPRRAEQLHLLRPDVHVVPIRGNIDTRMRRARMGDLDAVVLAAAGIERLGLADRIVERFDPGDMLPAPAQGALAVEVQEDLEDEELLRALERLDDHNARVAALCERHVLRSLEAGCSAPVGAFASVENNDLYLRAGVFRSGHKMTDEARGALPQGRDAAVAAAVELAEELAQRILDAGAAELLGARAG